MSHVLPSEGSIFTAKPEPLSDLLSGIHKHKVALPNFQRPWVWEPNMVRDLIISIAYRYPAGSLLTMPVVNGGFGLRAFEGSGTTLNNQPNLMVLDGQQRLTSLYQALYQLEGVTVKNRTYHFYVDVNVLMADEDGSIEVGDPFFEQALFFVMVDKKGRRIRYEDLKPLYEISTSDQELEVGALPLGLTFDADGRLAEWRKAYLVKKSEKDMDRYLELDGQWNKLIKPWLDRIRSYPFPVIELRANMPLGAICHIFEKVNSTGVALDVFDLCTAILWAQGFSLNIEWEKTRKQLKDAGILPMQPLSGTYFLQTISLLDSLERKRANPDSRIAVACRKDDLMALKATTVQKWWNILLDGYREASKFMTDNGILASRILPYTTLIIPLAAIFAYLKTYHSDSSIGAAWPKIARWYWCSVFSQRYGSRVDTNSGQDFEQVINWIENDDPLPDVVRTFTFRADALQEITSIRSAIYKGVLCLLARNEAKDFGGGGKLSTALFYDTRQDHHHIFPRNAFKTLGIQDDRSNTLVNKTFISASVNRSIGGRLPSTYVSDWRNRLAPDANFDEILRSHLIDPDILASDDWQAFLHDRRERLRQLIESVCGGVIQPFSDAELEIEDDEDDEE